MTKMPRYLVGAAAGLLVVLVAIQSQILWRNGTNLTQVAGGWIALASDAANGVFYRPMFSADIGYGGTRFTPLYFVLHAALIHLFGAAILSGFALSAVSTGALLSGMYVFLRRIGRDRWIAGTFSAFLLAGFAVQVGLTTIRGDMLPAALTVWGLAAALRAARDKRSLRLAVLFFAMAPLAKLTSLNGLIAATFWLWLTGEKRTARRLLAGATATMGLGFVAIQLASGGRFLEILRICGSGGADLGNIVLAPRTMLSELAARDVGALLFFALAAMQLLVFAPGALRSLAALFWVTTLAMTVFIFGSPGTAANHLIDLHVASVMVLACIGREDVERSEFAIVGAAVAAVLALTPVWGRIERPGSSRTAEIQKVVESVPDLTRPILSQDPLVPFVAGQRPYVLDAFMFRVLALRNPESAAPLFNGLRSGAFGAVVLGVNPEEPGAESWYENVEFGPGFVSELRRSYVYVRRTEHFFVYARRGTLSPLPSQ